MHPAVLSKDKAVQVLAKVFHHVIPLGFTVNQHVKAEAMKAPVKIIFPLVFFIFPSLFIVTLVPSALSLMKNLGGH